MSAKNKFASLVPQSLTALWIIVAMILTACSTTPTPPPPTTSSSAAVPAYWPTEAWRTSTPEEQGMDGANLAQMLAVNPKQPLSLSLHSLLVIRHGYIVSETYFESFGPDVRHELFSVTKSFTATLVGIAIDQGKIQGVDQRVLDYFPGQTWTHPDPLREKMTVEDLLTMRSGLDWQDDESTFLDMTGSQDWVKYVLDKPMAQAPGTQFNYCSGCSHVLSGIVQRATGVDTSDFARQYLFEPLGISTATWDVDPAHIATGGWGLQLTPRDMAKLGYLYLHNGVWDGQQIVSANWVQTATRQQTGSDDGYGYQWWIMPDEHGYAALGRYGQMIFVSPDFDLVVVMTAALLNHDSEFKLLDDYILTAVQKP